MPPDRREPDRGPPAGPIRHVLRVVLTAVAFSGFFLGAALLGSVVLQLARIWPGSLTERQRRCQRLVRASWVLFHDCLRWVGLVDFDRRRHALDVQAPAIVIANHPTLIDIMALTVAVGPACIVARRRFFPIRWSGHSCARAATSRWDCPVTARFPRWTRPRLACAQDTW
jgi:hypothetical protein